jgi:sugar (pentulose or hexulose) kinase
MNPEPVIAIIDVGKTNKKLLLFNKEYEIVYEMSARLKETVDEDGFPCENVDALRDFVLNSLANVCKNKEFQLMAVNFSAYGASFVHLGENNEPVTPLYNYLKPISEKIKKEFYEKYGGEENFSLATASPILGNLNSGMQLYRLKYEQPEIFQRIKTSLHLPQYLSSLVSGNFCSDITSIGCHTHLWDFQKNNYHDWVTKEGVDGKLAPVVPPDQTTMISFEEKKFSAGIGLHDSSAALIPYLVSFREPFVLISTGTWAISLNAFNKNPLTVDELRQDCLCYLSYESKPVKASRFFLGQTHDTGIKTITGQFNKSVDPTKIEFDTTTISGFSKDDRWAVKNETDAYHQLLLDLVGQQARSTKLVLNGSPVKRIFVDGGFSQNPVYMNLLAIAFPGMEVYAATMPQSTALGAALAIHNSWNDKPLPSSLIQLKFYSPPETKINSIANK